VYERYRYQSGDQDAEDPYNEFSKFYAGDTILMYAFVVFGNDDGMVDLLGKVCPDDSISDTGIFGEAKEKTNVCTIGRKRGKHVNNESNQSSNEKKFVLRMNNEKSSDGSNGKLAEILSAEQDEAQLSVLNTPSITSEMKDDALEALAQLQLLQGRMAATRRLTILNEMNAYFSQKQVYNCHSKKYVFSLYGTQNKIFSNFSNLLF
jgi:hypothetical protein